MGRIALLALVMICGAAAAQSSGAAAPRSSPPLSPYLNLLRGGNPAVNYFNAVRPGVQPGMVGNAMAMPTAGPRTTFFPGATTFAAADKQIATGPTPTGRGATFNNTMGYFGQTSGQFFTRGRR